jgi:ornithine cyclodeaminase/alanine dehydrogenase-like protein (mu-crystallin family)
MRVVTAADIDRVLTFSALIEALADAFRGGAVAPKRHHHDIDRGASGGTLLLMPAWTGAGHGRDASFMGVKVVSVFPANGQRGLPRVLGAYLLMDGDTGAPLAVLDGTRLTLWRTAAASALAARSLAREDTSRMAMVGAGALAPFMIRAHASQRPIREVTIWNRRPETARRLAGTLQVDGVSLRATEDLEEAVRKADLVACATLSTTPLVEGAWLKSGAHLDLVGAFKPGMREADHEALQRASVWVDTEAALTEGGDVAEALACGALGGGQVRGDLLDLCRGQALGRASPDEVTVFKSVGASIEDLAAAMLVWRHVGSAS